MVWDCPLSSCASALFGQIADQFGQPWFKDLVIVASNDINEETVISLNEQVVGGLERLARTARFSPIDRRW